MKNILMVSLSFALFCFQNLKAQTVQDPDTSKLPVITFETDTIDWGIVEYGSQAYRIFHFVNTGKEPLIINSVTTSDPHWGYEEHPKAYRFGESGTIKIMYDTKRVGKTSRYLTVNSNAKNSQKKIWIKVTVLPKKEEDPSFPFGK